MTLESQIKIVVSVDWEGRDLDLESMLAIEEFREKYPHVPMQHFLNAAYYTKLSANPLALTTLTRKVLRKNDCLGLHIHAWRSLCEKSNVTPRTAPNFRGEQEELRKFDDDWGHEIAIDAFSVDEIRALIRTSMEILCSEGFSMAKQFRSGAWLSGPNVTEALVIEGFLLDASALNRRFIKERWGDSPLYARILELWSDIDDCSQPYEQSTKHGSIIQAPNNGCLADYTSADDILSVFESLAKTPCPNPTEPQILSIGFHQETAKLYLNRLEEGLEKIEAYSSANGIKVSFANSALS